MFHKVSMFPKAWRAAIAAMIVVLIGVGLAAAQDRRQNQPGQFDFYVLALSWSPSYCEAASERPPRRSDGQQCGVSRPFHFVVHGLWPQYESGFPEYCQRDARRPDRGTISAMLDLMPSVGLIFHEWERHGTCSGLPPRAYFENVRKARASVKIPDEFMEVKEHLTVTPGQVEEAFLKANSGMTPASISVACGDRRRLGEVRICMSKEFGFRDCAENERRACRVEKLVMPPARGPRAAAAGEATNADASVPTPR
jgi:ribonuclease T2